MFFQIDQSFGDSFQIIGCAFLLSVPRPVAAFCLSQIHIVTEQSGEVGRSIFLFGFHFRKRFFCGRHNIRNPVSQTFDGAADSVHHAVSGFNVSVEIADVGFNAFAFQSRNGGSHVDGRDNIKPLSFIGTHIHTLGTSGKLQIFILNDFPSVSPFLGVILFVPVNGIFLMAFPSAGRELDTLAVLVKVINLSALGHPLSVFINGSHGQHDVAMGIVSRRIWVMDCKITTHSFGHKMLIAVFLHHLRTHFKRHFSRQGNNETPCKL